MGRPPGSGVKEIKDPADRIKQLASIGCTDAEIALVCDVGETTLRARFGDLLQRGHAEFKSRIREMQFKRALEGSDTMLIWLGKVVLGQKEQSEILINATDTLAAFVQTIREASPQGPKQVEGEEISPGEPLCDSRRGNGS